MIAFIIGVGRSGTHLLSQILDGSAEINFPMEQLFVLKTYRRLYNRPLTRKAKDLFIAHIKKDQFVTQFWKLDLEGLIKHIDSLPEKTPYHVLCNSVLAFRKSIYTSKENAKVLGYQNPRLTLHAENFMEIFPESKYIFLHRNAHDNIASFKNSGFFKGMISIPFFAYRWKWYNRHGLKLLKKYPHRVYKLAYEDMVSNPEAEIKKLCGFLNVSFTESMLGFEEKFKPFYNETIAAEKYHVHKKMTEKINNKNVNTYKKTLTPAEIDQVSYITNSTNRALGYEPSSYSFKLKYFSGFFEALYYTYRHDYYAMLQYLINKLLPRNKLIRFNRP